MTSGSSMLAMILSFPSQRVQRVFDVGLDVRRLAGSVKATEYVNP